MNQKSLFVCCLICLAYFASPRLETKADIILNWFGPSAYSQDVSQMDATLGISNFLIEDFEDTTLISGLSYSLTNPSQGTFNSLPNTFIASDFAFLNSHWDSNKVLTNGPLNLNPNAGNLSNNLEFRVAGGASSFGVGLGSFQSLSSPQYPRTNHRLVVNGIDLGVLESIATNFSSGLPRNAYLRIDATNGDSIQSVEFQNIFTSSSHNDVLVFDHVAIVTAVPEPSSLTFSSVLLLATFYRRRRRKLRQSQPQSCGSV